MYSEGGAALPPKGSKAGEGVGEEEGQRQEGREGSEVSAIRLPATLALVLEADQEKKSERVPEAACAQIFHALLGLKTVGSNLCMPLPAGEHALC